MQVSILGWSAGANVGAVFAAKYPERVSRLVLVNGNVRTLFSLLSRLRVARSKKSSWLTLYNCVEKGVCV